jgi:ribosomal protein S18 acetylase RimI-like enzyme
MSFFTYGGNMVALTWLLLTNPFLQTESILEVFLKAFLPQGRSNIEQLSDYFYNKIKPRLEENQLTITVLDQDNLVAFAIFEKWEEQSYYLAEMAVLPEYQLKGIGKQLVFSIFDKEQEASKILLVTKNNNTWSQTFYEKIGFKRSSFQHPNYPENFIGYEFCR